MSLNSTILIVLGIVALVAVASLVLGRGSSARTKEACQKLMQKAAQTTAAANQDLNELFAVIDATYALAYCDALNLVTADKNLKSIMGISGSELHIKAKEAQRNAIKRLGAEFPSLLPEGETAIAQGWT